MKFKRIFLMVLDSVGVGETTDAINFGDNGANTLGHINEQCDLFIPNLKKIGFLDTINMSENNQVDAYYTIAKPINGGKDSLNGHYEMMGIKHDIPFQTFNSGFPYEVINGIEQITGRMIIGNKCCTDDSILQELGERQASYGSLIVYTSADSDLQVAAHEDSIPIATLHQYCEKIRALTLKEELKRGLIRGESLQEMSRIMADKLNNEYSNALRLVRTETAWIQCEATKQNYLDNDIKYYEFSAFLDKKTSKICKDLDGKVIKVEEAIVGKNMPPLHPNCRSCMIPITE